MIQSSLSDGLLDPDPALKNWAKLSRRYAAAVPPAKTLTRVASATIDLLLFRVQRRVNSNEREIGSIP
jgi:hypothetical protein